MVIVFCGSPHSGKSVLTRQLKLKLPDDASVLFRASPDGEGDWSYYEGDYKADFRIKGPYTQEIVDRFCMAINNNKITKIVIVDVGGRRSEENKELFRHCDTYVIITSNEPGNEDEMEKWKEFADGIVKEGTEDEHLECFALIESELKGTEEIHSEGQEKGETFRGKAVRLERSRPRIESELIDKLAAKMVRESGYTLKDSREIELEHFSGLALAYLVGCQKVETIEGVQIPKAYFSFESIENVYDIIENLADEAEDKNVEVKINGVRAQFVLCVCAKAMHENGITNINTMDAENNKHIPIRKIEQREGINRADGIRFHIIESKDAIFIDLDVEGYHYTQEEYVNCILPKLDPNKPLYISGKVPNWLMASVVTSYENSRISVLQAHKGFICIHSNDRDELGKLELSVPGVDAQKFFDEKEDVKRTGKEFDCIVQTYLLEKDEVNNEGVGGRDDE